MKHALSAKAKANELIIIENVQAAEPKANSVKKQLDGLGLDSALIIDGQEVDKNFDLAARNIPHIDVLPIQGINVYDILRRNKLVLTKSAVEGLEARFK